MVILEGFRMKFVTSVSEYCEKCEDITYHRVEIKKNLIILKICMKCKMREIENDV